ncbi:hypothetical protein MIR68_005572 [Amoeboaphelidium protococcarum]|nr:hypothetical protein MIR68_005572 [Amoeboaphelidium protococcarum]
MCSKSNSQSGKSFQAHWFILRCPIFQYQISGCPVENIVVFFDISDQLSRLHFILSSPYLSDQIL